MIGRGRVRIGELGRVVIVDVLYNRKKRCIAGTCVRALRARSENAKVRELPNLDAGNIIYLREESDHAPHCSAWLDA